MRKISYFDTAVISVHTCRRLARLACFCAYVGRTSLGAGHRAGPPRVRSRQAGIGSGRTKRKGPPRVDKRAAKRGEHSVLGRHDSGYATYFATIFIYNPSKYYSSIMYATRQCAAYSNNVMSFDIDHSYAISYRNKKIRGTKQGNLLDLPVAY